jgi:hypothetical protein
MRMAVVDISIRSNIKQVQQSLSAFASQQVPYATSLALTSLANKVQVENTKALSQVFDRPTPFTQKAIGVKVARKNNLVATVFVKDIAASYLEPFEFGGMHKLNSRAMLNPKNVQKNQYGNLPRTLINTLKGRSDVFIGPVKTKNGGVINGVWQRPPVGKQRAGGRGTKGKLNVVGGQLTGLKLLIRFTDAQPVKQRLGYRARAKRIIDTNFDAEFSAALARSMASAKV